MVWLLPEAAELHFGSGSSSFLPVASVAVKTAPLWCLLVLEMKGLHSVH